MKTGHPGGPIPPRPTLQQRFDAKVDKNGPLSPGRPDLGPCWIWHARIHPAGGYGIFYFRGQFAYAHRASYMMHVGEIPTGLQIDHLCRVPACVNPQHLEPVTARVNTLRSNSLSAMQARQTHCKRGHPFDEANTIRRKNKRSCRQCRTDYKRGANQGASSGRRRSDLAPEGPSGPTPGHC